ncbi:MAG: hypothetical protein E8D46_13845 [Nitrospira sp.]|nr:MAG: hypothetical protein E8D46_13845 [Nitrospira sp.]
MHTKWFLLSVLLSSLLSSSVNAESSNTLRNVRGGADEAAALAYSKFTKPIELHFKPDGFWQAQKLSSMNGVSNHAPKLGAAYGYEPCDGRRNSYRHLEPPPASPANIGGYDLDNTVMGRWLSDNRFILVETYTIRYQNAGKPQSYGGEDVYDCKIVNDNVMKYLRLNQAKNIHDGLDIPIGQRILAKWTFRNRYDTPIPGKGKVKVFAGTFTYRIEPIDPFVAFPGEGTATVKLYLDPDNGRWTVDNWEMQDPGINLLTNPLPVNCKVFPLNSPHSILVSPYKGDCKDGMADGQGGYTYSFDNVKPRSVNGEFRNGKLNGKATITGENFVTKGDFLDNIQVYAITRGVDASGAKYVYEYRKDNPLVICSSDGRGEANCTDRDKLLGTE